MNNQKIGTLILSGEDSRNFAYSLFRPTLEEIEKNAKCLEKIDKNILIRKTDDGYEAEIADLELSFLDEPYEANRIDLEVTMYMKPVEIFYSNNQVIEATTFLFEQKRETNKFLNGVYISSAA